MKINFINYNGIEQYARVMYNDVKDADKYNIEVAYNGKDIKTLLEYLFEQEQENEQLKEDKKEAVKYINRTQMPEGYKKVLLEILGEKENE